MLLLLSFLHFFVLSDVHRLPPHICLPLRPPRGRSLSRMKDPKETIWTGSHIPARTPDNYPGGKWHQRLWERFPSPARPPPRFHLTLSSHLLRWFYLHELINPPLCRPFIHLLSLRWRLRFIQERIHRVGTLGKEPFVTGLKEQLPVRQLAAY